MGNHSWAGILLEESFCRCRRVAARFATRASDGDVIAKIHARAVYVIDVGHRAGFRYPVEVPTSCSVSTQRRSDRPPRDRARESQKARRRSRGLSVGRSTRSRAVVAGRANVEARVSCRARADAGNMPHRPSFDAVHRCVRTARGGVLGRETRRRPRRPVFNGTPDIGRESASRDGSRRNAFPPVVAPSAVVRSTSPTVSSPVVHEPGGVATVDGMPPCDERRRPPDTRNSATAAISSAGRGERACLLAVSSRTSS